MNETFAQGGKSLQEGIDMVHQLGDLATVNIVKYGFQVLGAVLILVIGWKIATWAAHLFTEYGRKRNLDVTLTKFIANTLRVILLVFVALMTIDKLGITISPLIATASALIFGASFAIQAPLSNYAAGLMVILTRPFVVGNTIKVKGVSGVVEEVKLPSTILVTEDGERITVPNKEIVGQILSNSAENKVVEKNVGIGYEDDPQKAVDVIRAALRSQSQVRQDPAPQIGIESFGDSAILIGMRYWVPTREYYHAMYAANLAVYRALKEAGVSIPYPQREVRMLTSPKD